MQGAHVERDGQGAPTADAEPTRSTSRARGRASSPQEAKEFITELWHSTDEGVNATRAANGVVRGLGKALDGMASFVESLLGGGAPALEPKNGAPLDAGAIPSAEHEEAARRDEDDRSKLRQTYLRDFDREVPEARTPKKPAEAGAVLVRKFAIKLFDRDEGEAANWPLIADTLFKAAFALLTRLNRPESVPRKMEPF